MHDAAEVARGAQTDWGAGGLLEQMLTRENTARALKCVKAATGSAGVDGCIGAWHGRVPQERMAVDQASLARRQLPAPAGAGTDQAVSASRHPGKRGAHRARTRRTARRPCEPVAGQREARRVAVHATAGAEAAPMPQSVTHQPRARTLGADDSLARRVTSLRAGWWGSGRTGLMVVLTQRAQARLSDPGAEPAAPGPARTLARSSHAGHP